MQAGIFRPAVPSADRPFEVCLLLVVIFAGLYHAPWIATLVAGAAALPDGAAITAMISVGVATCGGDACSRQELWRAADAALYQAKRTGRNRVCVAAAHRLLTAVSPALSRPPVPPVPGGERRGGGSGATRASPAPAAVAPTTRRPRR